MAKIHTHYDNLKVARLAPPEVIRAAYKALSQKYHPDKNPGDEKAARIMAIVNTAYTTLNDPVRRREHDEWIAAEEWEVAWLESTRQDEGARARTDGVPGWQSAEAVPVPVARPRVLRQVLLMLASGALGAGAALALAMPERVLPALGLVAAPRLRAAPIPAVRESAPPVVDTDPAPIAALATAALVVPPPVPGCAGALHSAAAPNGEPWPVASGYVAGYPLANPGKQMQLFIDNSGNDAPVFIRVYDLDRNANVRHAFIQPGASFTVSELAAGKYEVRYQAVLAGADCPQAAPPDA